MSLVIAFAAATSLGACKDSPTAPGGEQVVDGYRWQATYATAEKWGGLFGVWYPKSDIVITADRRVIVGSTEIVNSLVGETTISWSMADGNSTNASLQLLAESSSNYFWGNAGAAGKLFQGWIQYPGQGKLDYRGLAR
jgi:hypothetical protein